MFLDSANARLPANALGSKVSPVSDTPFICETPSWFQATALLQPKVETNWELKSVSAVCWAEAPAPNPLSNGMIDQSSGTKPSAFAWLSASWPK